MDVLSPAVVNSLALAAVYLPMALGLNLIFGVMNVLNFAHGELYMLGGMMTYLLASKTGIGFFPSMLFAVIIVAIFGILIERVMLRPLGKDILAALVVTLGLSLILQTSTLLVAGSDTKRYIFPLKGMLSIGSTNLSMERFTVSVIGFVGAGVFYLLLQRTQIGRAIRAVAQDKFGATIQGINPSLAFAVTMGLGTALAALAGSLAGSMFGAEPFMGADALIFPFIILTLGGLGSIEGTFVAAIAMGFVQSFVTIYVGATEAAIAGFLLLYLTLLIRPNGLLGRARTGML